MEIRGPSPTVDIIIELLDPPHTGKIVLIERKFEPLGWAIPGGFIDYGESAETAAVREAEEEVGLAVTLVGQIGVYSDPSRDRRRHTLSVVYVATAHGTPKADTDAKAVAMFSPDAVPSPLCFDHGQILADYRLRRASGAFIPIPG